jgi:hypothetical protein
VEGKDTSNSLIKYKINAPIFFFSGKRWFRLAFRLYLFSVEMIHLT